MSGEPLTQKQSSQFLPAAPGIRPCATRRTLAPRRRSRVPCSTDRVEHDVGVPRLPLHRCVLDRLAGAGDGVQKPHAPRLPASPGDAVAQRGRCHRWGLGGKPSRLRRIMRALQDDTLRVFWARPLFRPALVPSGLRLQVHRMAQRSPFEPLLTASRIQSRVPRRTLSPHPAHERGACMVTSMSPGFHQGHGVQRARSLGTFVPFPDPLPEGLRHGWGFPTLRLLCPICLPAGPRRLRCGSPLPPLHSPSHPLQALPCPAWSTHTSWGRWHVPRGPVHALWLPRTGIG